MRTVPIVQKGLISSLYFSMLTKYPKITDTKVSIVKIPVFFVIVREPIKHIWPATMRRPEKKIDLMKVIVSTGYFT